MFALSWRRNQTWKQKSQKELIAVISNGSACIDLDRWRMSWMIFWRCFPSLTWQKSCRTLLPGAPVPLFALKSVKAWTSSFQRSIGLLNSWTSVWREVTFLLTVLLLFYVFGGSLFLFWKWKNSYSLWCQYAFHFSPKGELMFSPHMQVLQSALFCDAVPDTWTNLAYLSIHIQLCPLASTLQ